MQREYDYKKFRVVRLDGKLTTVSMERPEYLRILKRSKLTEQEFSRLVGEVYRSAAGTTQSHSLRVRQALYYLFPK
jgi:predicted DNA-binding ribbon-helix-helix protein